MSKVIIAQLGSVHDDSFGSAKQLIDVAAERGADVVKFQTHIAAAETVRDAPMPACFTGVPRFEYFERTAFSVSSGRWSVSPPLSPWRRPVGRALGGAVESGSDAV